MARNTLVRGCVAVAAAFTIVSGTTGTATAGTASTAVTAPDSTTVPAIIDTPPANDAPVFAGDTGFLHQVGPSGGALAWTPYAGGPDTPVTGTVPAGVGRAGSGDLVATLSGSTVTLHDMAAGTATDVVLPDGQSYEGVFGGRVVTKVADGTGVAALHVLGTSGGQQTDTTVTGWPAGARIVDGIAAGDSGDSAVVSYTDADNVVRPALLDLTNGQITPLFTTLTQSGGTAVLSADRIGWVQTSGSTATFHLVGRDDPTGPERTVKASAPGALTTLPAAVVQPRGLGLVGGVAIVAFSVTHGGDRTLGDTLGYPLYAVQLAGGAMGSVLDHADPNAVRTGPAGVLADGGTTAGDWATRRVTATADGTVTQKSVAAHPGVASRIRRISLAGGELVTNQTTGAAPGNDAYSRIVRMGSGVPTYTAASRYGKLAVDDCGTGCPPLTGTGDNRISQLDRAANAVTLQGPHGVTRVASVPPISTLVGSDGPFVLYEAGSPARLYAADSADGRVLWTGPVTGASLWGGTLWTAGAQGTLTHTDLATGELLATVHTGATCTVDDVQAAGVWVYWSCGATGPAGVWNSAKGTGTAVPSGRALAGDGYLVRHVGGQLVLTDFHTGAPADEYLAVLPASATDDRGLTWSVDRFAGGVAYVDAGQAVHLADPNVPSSPFAVTGTVARGTLDYGTPWTAEWQLSKPAVTLTMTIEDAAGNVVKEEPESWNGSSITAGWTGDVSEGGPAPDGTYTWHLTVADGTGATLSRSGTIALRGTSERFRDYRETGLGSVYTTNTKGDLTGHYPGGGSLLGAKSYTAGWAEGSTAVPIGDVTGDGCNDMVVRTPAGVLDEYTVPCGDTAAPKDPRVIGTGYQQYKWLASPGDLNGDGLPDLVAWKTATGDLYVYDGLANGGLAPRRVVRSNQQYLRIAAVGDSRFTGVGDLVALDHEHRLWLMPGDGEGGFGPRQLVFSDWGTTYDTVVGAGDLTGDLLPDLVERDSSGVMWLNKGLGRGKFAARVKVATGWQSYTGIF